MEEDKGGERVCARVKVKGEGGSGDGGGSNDEQWKSGRRRED